DQASRVIELLRALVDHFADNPAELPSDALPESEEPGGDAVRLAAVRHVSGMTDRYACRSAVRLLDWDVERLPA
ncbi:MAG TPA: deoxyguanosinetriphosphate triphosphohydrolase, partial [Acidimicrobiaceae bacterium]|nr:deoxyguanosinetriphosphate triphosphohydrolase [Acidimicrobiaceae bacterium]